VFGLWWFSDIELPETVPLFTAPPTVPTLIELLLARTNSSRRRGTSRRSGWNGAGGGQCFASVGLRCQQHERRGQYDGAPEAQSEQAEMDVEQELQRDKQSSHPS
jgi:hypothetical protein